MKRHLALAAVPALAVALLSAPTAHADAPKITDKDFLSTAQVASFVPALADATSEKGAIKVLPILKTCSTTANVKPKKAQTVTWVSPTNPGVISQTVIMQFKNVKQAKTVVKSRRAGIKCGTVSSNGITATATAIEVPKLGNETVGERTTVEGLPMVTDAVVARKGARIITVGLISTDGTSAGDLNALAKQAYKAGL